MEDVAEAPRTLWVELLGAEVHYVDAQGTVTRVIEAGEGPAVVFLHGGGGHAEAFARNIVPIAEEGLRVIAIDYLGHGLTERPDGPIDRDAYVTHLVATLDALGIDSAVLAGESLGGWIAFWTALLHPNRVRRLVSICGARLEVERDPESDRHVTEGRQRFKELNQAFLANPSPETVRDRLAWLFYDPETSITDELVQLRWALYQRALMQKTLQDGIGFKEGRQSAKPTAEDYPFDAETLARIHHETLVLWTSHNPSNTAATARTAASYMPNARFALMEECGHWPQWEDPPTFNRLLTDFALGRAPVGEQVPQTASA